MSSSLEYTLAIDPGLRCVGWALFQGARLCYCGVSRSKHPLPLDCGTEHAAIIRSALPGHRPRMVVECPKIYPLSKQKGDQNDLVNIALVGAQIMGVFGPGEGGCYVYPHTWKGQMPKDVSHRRILARLDAKEEVVLEMLPKAKTVRHNGMDAVGIGLWAVGRKA